MVVKQTVQVAKRMADRRWRGGLECVSKMFWKEVMRVRKGEQAIDEMVAW